MRVSSPLSEPAAAEQWWPRLTPTMGLQKYRLLNVIILSLLNWLQYMRVSDYRAVLKSDDFHSTVLLYYAGVADATRVRRNVADIIWPIVFYTDFAKIIAVCVCE